MQSSSKAISKFRRANFVYAVLAAFILVAGPSHLLFPAWWQRQEMSELLALALPTLVGTLLGLLSARDIWNLVVRRNPLWKDLLFAALVFAVLLALILLREFGVWVWSFAAGDALALSLLATMAVVTSVTEHTKRVRVYAFARHFAFESGATDV